MRSPDELTDAFRASGLKITPQRQAVFRVLHEAREHPTAEAVHAAVVAEMPSVSLRTVYQVLNDLTAMGELAALDLGTGSTRFDPTDGDHHHLVCTQCGAVRDVFLDAVELEVPEAQAAGYRLGRPEITFRGLCPDCIPTSTNPRKALPLHG
jgi:Fe2+ or Zn2+ uptake regulation protein